MNLNPLHISSSPSSNPGASQSGESLPVLAMPGPLRRLCNRVFGRIGPVCGALLVALAAGPSFAADAPETAAKPDKAKGETIAGQVCMACHGADGNSPLPANPKLAGQHYDYLLKQLRNFKAQGDKPAARANAVMAGFASQLSDADMQAVAAFYSAQQLQPEAATDKALAEAGRALYRGGDASRGLPSCAGCHGPAGAGIPGQYPSLAGQYADYTASQLTAFRQGVRKNSVQMSVISAKLSDSEIKALSDYIAGLR